MEEIAIRRNNVFYARCYHFVMNSGVGALAAFTGLFMDRRGLNASQIGLIIAMGSIVSLLSAPTIVRLFSESEKPLRVLRICILAVIASTMAFSFQSTFLGIAVFHCLRTMFNSNFYTTADMITLKAISGSDVGYGSVRVWGSIGWAPVVLVTGYLIEVTDVRITAYLCAGFALVSIFVLGRFRFEGGFTRDKTVTTRRSYLSGVKELFHDKTVLFIMIVIIVSGIGNAGVLNFEILFFDRLGASDTLIGILGMISAVVEIPCMIATDRLIRRYGAVRVLFAAQLIYASMRLLVILAPAIPVVLIARALTGVGLSFNAIGYVTMINDRYDMSKAGGALVVLTVTIPTLITIIFTPVFGLLMDRYGGMILYYVSFAGFACCALFYALTNRNTDRRLRAR